jgi:hypothetical protein
MQKVIKIDDQYLTMSHYKEPLLELKKSDGFGYYGCILVSLDKQFIQCHICGKLFSHLGTHVGTKHKMRAEEYRNKFLLAKTTALVSETQRQRMKEHMLKVIQRLSPEEKKQFYLNKVQMLRNGSKLRRKYQPKESLESKNKKGTCPDQLIAKIHEAHKKLGRTPSLAEFIDITDGQRYKHLIFTTFGSWLNALKIAKLQPKERKLDYVRHEYSDEELLEYLSLYAQENGKLPTATDCKRGLLPDYNVYIRHFGSFPRARELAGVYQFIKPRE